MNELNGKLTNYYIPGTDAELYWTKSDDEEDNKINDEIDEQANELDHFKIIGLFDWAKQNDKYMNLLNEFGVAELDVNSLKIELGINTDNSIKSVDDFDSNWVQLNKPQKDAIVDYFYMRKGENQILHDHGISKSELKIAIRCFRKWIKIRNNWNKRKLNKKKKFSKTHIDFIQKMIWI